MDFKQGDIIYMDFSPTKGHEQSGRRPAIIVSNNDYQRLVGLSIVCPITNTIRNHPTHVKLDNRTQTTGDVLCEQLRTVDLHQRNAKFIEKIPKDLFEEILDIVQACF